MFSTYRKGTFQDKGELRDVAKNNLVKSTAAVFYLVVTIAGMKTMTKSNLGREEFI